MDAAFIRREMVVAMEPPRISGGLHGLVRQRLFGSVFNTIVTILSATILTLLVWPAVKFLLIDAVWHGSSRDDCLAEVVGSQVVTALYCTPLESSMRTSAAVLVP